MSTADFHPILVRDKNLCFSDNLPYACFKGAQNNSIQRLQANSESNSAIIWNVVTPSETVALNRHVLWEGSVTIMNQLFINIATATTATVNALSVIGAGASNVLGAAGPLALATGNNPNVNGPAGFPLHSCLNTMQATLNNQTVSSQIRDILPFLETVNSYESSEYINSLCPHQRDVTQRITDNYGNVKNPYGSYEDATPDYTGNGCYQVEYYYVDKGTGLPVRIDNSTLLNVNGTGAVAPYTTPWTIIIKIKSTEPLLMSPFVFAKDQEGSAMYGLQQMNLTLNVGAPNRVWRTSIVNNATTGGVGTGQISWIGSGFQYVSGFAGFQPFENDYLHLNYLTPFPSQLLSSRCVVPYMQIARYITPVSNPVIAIPANDSVAFPEFSTTLQAVNLASIPDKIALCIRYKNSLKTNQDADWNCVINKVIISWNNSQGLLSSANIYDLYRMSLEAGSNLSFPEFAGRTFINDQSTTNTTVEGSVGTIGSMLVLDIGKHLALDSDWFAPGSLSTTQVLITVNYAYQGIAGLAADSLEAVLYTCDSGLIVNERGTTATYIGIMSKQQVLETSASETYYNDGDIQRLIGGSFWGSLKSGLSSVWNAVKPVVSTIAPIAKNVLSNMPNPAAQTASNVLGALGYGQSGGGPSGGMKRRLK